MEGFAAMIKDNQTKLNKFHVVLDAAVIAGSYALAWLMLVVGNRLFSPHKQILAPRYYFSVLIVLVPVYLILYAVFHLYAPKRVQQRRYEFANICKANFLGLLLFVLILFLVKRNPYFREFLPEWYFISVE